MTMTINGSGSITGLSAGGLPDGTIQQADLATGVAGNGPAFSAYASGAQTIANQSNVKILFDTEEFDTNSNYSSSRFTPTVAGYYQISATVTSPTTNASYGLVSSIWKNGSYYKLGSASKANSGMYPSSNVSSLVYLNGSTDYVEIYAYGDMGGSWNTTGSIYYTFFNGAMVRSA